MEESMEQGMCEACGAKCAKHEDGSMACECAEGCTCAHCMGETAEPAQA